MMETKTFTFRIDKDTKQILKSMAFKNRFGTINQILQSEFDAILQHYFANFSARLILLPYFVEHNIWLSDPMMDQKVSIQLNPQLKTQLETILEQDERVPFFMRSLTKFCQWSLIDHVQQLTQSKLPPMKVTGPPIIADKNRGELTYLMIFTRGPHTNQLFVPCLRKTYTDIQTRYEVMAVLSQIKLDMHGLCHGLKPRQFPSDNWLLDYQLKANQSLLQYTIDMQPFWNHEK